jgi:tripartite-type tricarboxylate transporter receptor subunit TctC
MLKERRGPRMLAPEQATEGTMTKMRAYLTAVAGMLMAMTAAAPAQDYPARPVRIVVPFAPAGLNDILARTVAAGLTERLGKQFIVENKTGAGGIVGSELVAKSPPDGYTLLIVSIAHAVNPALYKLPYDPHKAFAPISIFASSPNALAINPDLPAKNLKEFIALAKSKPGDIQYGSGGVGGSLHLGMELFKLVAHVDLLHVPFRGAGPAVIDVAGGHTKAIIATVTTLAPHIRNGKLRGLAVSGKVRSRVLPDVPTFEEGGVPDYEAGNWIGLAAPAGTPDAIIQRLNTEIGKIQDSAEFKQRLDADGADIVKMKPAEFGAYMERELEKWGRVVKEAGIKAQ